MQCSRDEETKHKILSTFLDLVAATMGFVLVKLMS